MENDCPKDDKAAQETLDTGHPKQVPVPFHPAMIPNFIDRSAKHKAQGNRGRTVGLKHARGK